MGSLGIKTGFDDATFNIRLHKGDPKTMIKLMQFGKDNIFDFTPKLPKGWKDFKIVETQEGTFTGQISIDNYQKFAKSWDKQGRKKLAKLTKEYLEILIGYKIQPYNKSIKDKTK